MMIVLYDAVKEGCFEFGSDAWNSSSDFTVEKPQATAYRYSDRYAISQSVGRRGVALQPGVPY